MNFGRNILLLLGLILLLSGALTLSRIYRPKDLPVAGGLLYPLRSESITGIAWDVAGPDGKRCRMELTRKGEFWQMTHPYPGARCDAGTVATLLDAVEKMRIVSRLGKAGESDFVPERHLTLSTADRSFTCAFSGVMPMELSQTLVETQGQLVTIEADRVAALPQTAAALRTRAILPVSADRIRQLEWRGPDQPFTRVSRLPTGNWTVALPFPFDPKAGPVAEALKRLTDPKTVTAYVRPADTAPAATLPEIVNALATDTALSGYGLDEENALRLTVLVRGVRDGFTLRFGKEDPADPGQVFCLLDGYQAVVTVPAAIKEIFGAKGPFVTNFRDLPILSDLPEPDSIELLPGRGEAAVGLKKQHGSWSLTRPTALAAEHPAVRELLEDLSTLTGDLMEGDTPATAPLLTLTLAADGPAGKPCELAVYDSAEEGKLKIVRRDQNRLYRIRRDALPDFLFRPNLDRAFVNRTILSLPAGAIRRIAVLHRDGTSVTVRKRADGLGWETENPVGAYVNAELLDEWLTRFAELKATRVLADTPSTFGSLQTYGLDVPYLRLTLDLSGGDEGLRKILLIGTRDPETGTAPAMIQGRRVLYQLNAEDLAAFQLLPAQQEALP